MNASRRVCQARRLADLSDSKNPQARSSSRFKVLINVDLLKDCGGRSDARERCVSKHTRLLTPLSLSLSLHRKNPTHRASPSWGREPELWDEPIPGRSQLLPGLGEGARCQRGVHIRERGDVNKYGPSPLTAPRSSSRSRTSAKLSFPFPLSSLRFLAAGSSLWALTAR